MNLKNAWDIAMGSGVIIYYPHEVDYANLAHLTEGNDFHVSSYKTEFETISGGTHRKFTLKAGTSKADVMPACFWYRQTGGSNPNKYAIPTGASFNNNGCYYSAILTNLNSTAEACRSAYFGLSTGYCRDGEWRSDWDIDDTPTPFTMDELATGGGYVENSGGSYNLYETTTYTVNGYDNPFTTVYESRANFFFATSGLGTVSSLGITGVIRPTGTLRVTAAVILNNFSTFEVYIGDEPYPYSTGTASVYFNIGGQTKIGEQYISTARDFEFDFDASDIESFQETCFTIKAESFNEFNGTLIITDAELDLYLAGLGQGVPPAYSPFSRYTSITPVINGNITPETYQAGGTQSPVGVAPRSVLYLGDASGTNTSGGGAFIRLNPTETRLSRASDIGLVEPVGDNHNLMTTPSNPGVLSIGHCRWIGNELEKNSFGNQTTTGNYGAYAGRGRSSSIMFTFPSDRVWSSRHGMTVGTGLTGATRNRFTFTQKFTYEENDAYLSAGMAAGAIALVKSKNPTWNFEDCITSLYQSCNKYQFRTMPKDSGGSGYLGSNINLSSNITDTGDSIGINTNPGGQDSTSWYHALPEDGLEDIYGNSYNVIQFGTGPDDPEYELIKYSTKHLLSADPGEKDQSSYPNGVLSGCTRGYGGTTAKAHTSLDNVYTPLLTHTGWNEYMGWGTPDLAKALKVTTDRLQIMPPWTATGTLNSNNDVVITAMPFRSSNYDRIVVKKSYSGYPLTPDQGETVFVNSGSSLYVTGVDSDLASGRLYYSVFQFASGINLYSQPAKYASFYVDVTGWDMRYRTTTGGVSIKWATHDNVTGYKAVTSTGGYAIDTAILSKNNAYFYSNTGSISSVDIAIMGYASGNSLVASSESTYTMTALETPTGYITSYRNRRAVFSVDSSESYTKVNFHSPSVGKIGFVMSGGVGIGDHEDYYRTTVSIETSDGRLSDTGHVYVTYKNDDYTVDEIVTGVRVVQYGLPKYTTTSQPVYTESTQESGLYIEVTTGEYFDVINVKGRKELVSKPFVFKRGSTEIGSGTTDRFTCDKARYPSGSYSVVIPRFLN